MNVFMPRSCAFSYKDRGTSLILGILCDKIINEFAGMWIPGLEHPQRRCGNASKYKRIAVRCTVIPRASGNAGVLHVYIIRATERHAGSSVAIVLTPRPPFIGGFFYLYGEI